MSFDMRKYSNRRDIFGWYCPVHTETKDWIKWKEFIDNNSIDEDLNTLYEIFLMKEKKKKKLNKESKFVFITIQTFKQKYNDLDKYKQFMKNIKYLYSEGFMVLESGSVEPPDCNLHLHLLVKIIQPKKHKFKLDLEFKKMFNMSIYDKDFYKLKQWNESPLMPPYDQWLKEKIDYFDNSKKGCHGNSIELNCFCEW